MSLRSHGSLMTPARSSPPGVGQRPRPVVGSFSTLKTRRMGHSAQALKLEWWASTTSRILALQSRKM
eukprot:scaffold11522_cov148-Skeletonema_marinoi.AAC.4